MQESKCATAEHKCPPTILNRRRICVFEKRRWPRSPVKSRYCYLYVRVVAYLVVGGVAYPIKSSLGRFHRVRGSPPNNTEKFSVVTKNNVKAQGDSAGSSRVSTG